MRTNESSPRRFAEFLRSIGARFERKVFADRAFPLWDTVNVQYHVRGPHSWDPSTQVFFIARFPKDSRRARRKSYSALAFHGRSRTSVRGAMMRLRILHEGV